MNPLPQIIIFQFNPTQLTRTLTPYSAPAAGGGADGGSGSANTTSAAPYDPQESIRMDLEFDALDDIGERLPLFGVADRLAAMEMLLYPTGSETLVGAAISSLISGDSEGSDVPRQRIPTILFTWGMGRVVPVKLTEFKITEEEFTGQLYPIRAKAEIEMTILSSASIRGEGEDLNYAQEIAAGAYDFTRGQKEILSIANTIGSLGSLGDLLPF